MLPARSRVTGSSKVVLSLKDKSFTRGAVKLLPIVYLVLPWAGVYIAGVLSFRHAFGLIIPCGENIGCEYLAFHPSSFWLGIPISFFGFIAYFALGVFSIATIYSNNKYNSQMFLANYLVSFIGVVVSLYLVYQSVIQINVLCIWCLSSAIVMTLILFTNSLLAQAPLVIV